MPGDTPSACEKDPFGPFPVSAITAAAIYLPGPRVLPGQVVAGVIWWKLFRASHSLPRARLDLRLDGSKLPRQLILSLPGEIILSCHIPPEIAKSARTDLADFA